jgi:hypothetical protein
MKASFIRFRRTQLASATGDITIGSGCHPFRKHLIIKYVRLANLYLAKNLFRLQMNLIKTNSGETIP